MAKKLSVDERTFTLCGTPGYLAPEILLEQGYSYPADWWALGVFIFQMSHGHLPFRAENQMMMYEDIMLGRKRYKLRMLVGGLLEVQPDLRHGVKEVKEDPWFEDISWDQLFLKQAESPHIRFKEEENIQQEDGCQFQSFDLDYEGVDVEDEFKDF